MWNKLSPSEAATLYRVPSEVAEDASWAFLEWEGQSRRGGMLHGPWSLVSLQKHPMPGWRTFRIAKIDTLFIESPDYDPISAPGNHLLLPRSAVESLSDLMEVLVADLGGVGSVEERIFDQIESDELARYGLQREVFGGHTQSFFRQIGDWPGRHQEEVAVLFFSSVAPPPADLVHIGLCRFRVSRLEDPDFDPVEQGTRDLLLDAAGFSQLAELLRQEATRLR
jgi:hypothetical protein